MSKIITRVLSILPKVNLGFSCFNCSKVLLFSFLPLLKAPYFVVITNEGYPRFTHPLMLLIGTILSFL